MVVHACFVLTSYYAIATTDEDVLAAASIPSPKNAARRLGLLSSAMNTQDARKDTNRKKA